MNGIGILSQDFSIKLIESNSSFLNLYSYKKYLDWKDHFNPKHEFKVK